MRSATIARLRRFTRPSFNSTLLRSIVFVLVVGAAVDAFAKRTAEPTRSSARAVHTKRTHDLPPDVRDYLDTQPRLTSVPADTFVLGSFDFGGGSPDMQGWTPVDLTDQLDLFFHVASGSGELTGGSFGNLVPLEGNNSMWCGKAPDAGAPYCSWFVLPGYGNNWNQTLKSSWSADSVCVTYKVFWTPTRHKMAIARIRADNGHRSGQSGPPRFPSPGDTICYVLAASDVSFSIATRGEVSLRIYNVRGQLVRTLVDELTTPQENGFSVIWDGRNDVGDEVSSGVYFYRLTAPDFVDTKKMVMIR